MSEPRIDERWVKTHSASVRHDRKAFVAIVVGLIMVAGCPILFAIVGGLVAAGLDGFAPGYYPGMYFQGRDRHALGFGVTTGVLQGLMLGLPAGIAIVASLGWFRQLRPKFCALALAVVATFGAGFAVAGALIGYGLGACFPDYYRVVCHGEGQPGFDAVDVGIGLGCSEGLMIGAVVGTFVAVVLAWRRTRHPPQPQGGAPLGEHNSTDVVT